MSVGLYIFIYTISIDWMPGTEINNNIYKGKVCLHIQNEMQTIRYVMLHVRPNHNTCYYNKQYICIDNKM